MISMSAKDKVTLLTAPEDPWHCCCDGTSDSASAAKFKGRLVRRGRHGRQDPVEYICDKQTVCAGR